MLSRTGNYDSNRILVIAAHPDDEVLGCGGLIARERKRDVAVRVVFMAEGVTARFDPEEFNLPEVVAASRQRNDNAIVALGKLGVQSSEVFTNSKYCCRLDQVPQIDLVKSVEQHLDDFRPTHVLTHAAHDTNVDHRLSHLSVIAACRPVRRAKPRSILTFEVLSSTEWNPIPFEAQVFANITEEIDAKIEGLLAYGDEVRQPPHPRSSRVIRALAEYRGAQIGVNFAEAFGVIRECWD